MDLKEQFLAQFQSEYTIVSYTRDLEVFFAYLNCKNITIRDLTMDKLREYCKTDSNRRRLACIKSFIKYSYNQGYISMNCGRCIILPKKNPKKKQITMDIGEKLLNEAKKVNNSYYLFVLLLKQLGLRLNELRLLKHEHITMEDQILCFHILGKGNKARTVFLSPTLSRKVIRMIRNKTGYLFSGRTGPLSRSGCQYRIKLLAKRIGKPYISCHYLRHMFCTQLLRNKHDLASVRDMMGHSSITTTNTYLHGSCSKIFL
jgi:site-specific recombinase XerD